VTKPELSFEQAFERLEKILSDMNEGKLPLEKSLKLYEEADSLMKQCNNTLNSAEQKIEKLIKGRDGSLDKSPFHPENEQILARAPTE